MLYNYLFKKKHMGGEVSPVFRRVFPHYVSQGSCLLGEDNEGGSEIKLVFNVKLSGLSKLTSSVCRVQSAIGNCGLC